MSANKIGRPHPSWVPLAMGPFRYRRIAGFDLDDYQDGTSDADLCRWAESNGGGHFDFEWFGAICFIAGMALFTFYPDQLEQGLQADDLQDSGGDQQTREAWAKAINALWKRMTQEFQCAVAANACKVYGRLGNSTAADRNYIEIGAHHFSGCQVVRWGSPKFGGARLKLADGAFFNDLHVAARTADPSPIRRGRPPKIDWEEIRSFVYESLDDNGYPDASDPDWSCQADVERAVGKHIQEKIGASIGEERIRHYTRIFIRDWRQAKDEK
jgi:hypothetical protein